MTQTSERLADPPAGQRVAPAGRRQLLPGLAQGRRRHARSRSARSTRAPTSRCGPACRRPTTRRSRHPAERRAAGRPRPARRSSSARPIARTEPAGRPAERPVPRSFGSAITPPYGPKRGAPEPGAMASEQGGPRRRRHRTELAARSPNPQTWSGAEQGYPKLHEPVQSRVRRRSRQGTKRGSVPALRHRLLNPVERCTPTGLGRGVLLLQPGSREDFRMRKRSLSFARSRCRSTRTPAHPRSVVVVGGQRSAGPHRRLPSEQPARAGGRLRWAHLDRPSLVPPARIVRAPARTRPVWG